MIYSKTETNYKKKLFFKKTSNVEMKKINNNIEFEVIKIYPKLTYQTFIGFGGAITESTGYSIKLLSPETQKKIIYDYFSKEGLNYSLCRLPIGSSDFSQSSYSYSKKIDLSDFNISKDYEYIIPTIKEAQKIKPDIKFLASPWSPPSFMKSNNQLTNGGFLKENYKSTYAEYLAKYIKCYKNENININFITPQNEPNANQSWESCIYSPKDEIDFITNYLYPCFLNKKINTKILMWDHNKDLIIQRVSEEKSINSSLSGIDGFAFHWYTGDHFENIDLLHKLYPEKILIHTEGCTGYSFFKKSHEIKNAEIYAHDIIGDLNAGTNGYIDWNMVLDHKGGPNHKFNYCNSPIMLNWKHTDYIKNLSYYYIGHFSKFIENGSIRIATSRYTDKIEVVSFKNPDNSISIILLNKTDKNQNYNLVIDDNIIKDNISKHSIISYKIKN